MMPERSVPEFFSHWRQDWPAAGPWRPLDYLDQDESLRVVLLAQWLFCPEFVEYRGGVYLADRFSEKGIDEWLANPGLAVPDVEEVVNRVKLWSVFEHCELSGMEVNLDALAVTLKQCWRGALLSRFPHRTFTVLSEDEDSGVYGPGVTFFGPRPSDQLGVPGSLRPAGGIGS